MAKTWIVAAWNYIVTMTQTELRMASAQFDITSV